MVETVSKGQYVTDLICMNQHHESISLTAGIFLIDKKIMDQLGSIWDEMFKVPETNECHQLLTGSLINEVQNTCGKVTELFLYL